MASTAFQAMSSFLDLIEATPHEVLDAPGARELGFATQGAMSALGMSGFYPIGQNRTLQCYVPLAQSLALELGGNGPAFLPLLGTLRERAAAGVGELNLHGPEDFDTLVSGISYANLRRPALYVGVNSYFAVVQFLRGALVATYIREPLIREHLAPRLMRVESHLQKAVGVTRGPWYELIRMVSCGNDNYEGLALFQSLWRSTKSEVGIE